MHPLADLRFEAMPIPKVPPRRPKRLSRQVRDDHPSDRKAAAGIRLWRRASPEQKLAFLKAIQGKLDVMARAGWSTPALAKFAAARFAEEAGRVS